MYDRQEIRARNPALNQANKSQFILNIHCRRTDFKSRVGQSYLLY